MHVSRHAGEIRVAGASGHGPPAVSWTMAERSKSGSVIESRRGVNRTEQRIKPGQPVQLADGDHIRLAAGIHASVHWRPIIIGAVNVDVPSEHELERLGVTLICDRHIDTRCTHICLRQTRPSKSLFLALIYGMHVVSQAFVHALAGLVHVDPRPAPLPLPDPAAYAPPPDTRIDMHIPPYSLRPDTRRRTIFSGRTIFFAVHKIDRRALDTVELCEAAMGRVVLHDVSEAPIASVASAHALIEPVCASARQRASEHGAPEPLLVMCDDEAPWAHHLASAAHSLGAVFASQGTEVVSECILNVHDWHSAADETRANDSADEFPPTQPAHVLIRATQGERDAQWDSDVESSDVDVVAVHIGASQPADTECDTTHEALARQSISPTASQPESQPQPPAESTPQEPQPAAEQASLPEHGAKQQEAQPVAPPAPQPAQTQDLPRKARRLDAADVFELATQDPVLPERRGTREARRSFLVDEIFRASDPPALPTQRERKSTKYREILQSQEAASQPSTARESAPASEHADAHLPLPPATPFTGASPSVLDAPQATPLSPPLRREEFMRVDYVPLVRRAREHRCSDGAPNFKKFRRKHRTLAPRVALSRDTDSNDTLFLGD